MTGGSLHTKYRPTKLEEVVGQDHLLDGLDSTLKEAIQQAFLFEGPSGTGKTTLARIAAERLGCTEVIEVDAASNSSVENMRNVASTAHYASLDGGGKAFIVDECHRLSKQAWESLLKMIEEPPAGVYWFFCTTEGNKVLKTIRTRCITYTLKDVGAGVLVAMLERVNEREELNIPHDVLKAAAREAGGSPRQALVNLSAVKHTDNAADAFSALARSPGDAEAYDLAKMLIDPQFDFGRACELLKQLKETPPESIRHTVRAYATTAVLNSPSNRWARGVLMAFETPSVEHNQISDILCRVITMDKWRK